MNLIQPVITWTSSAWPSKMGLLYQMATTYGVTFCATAACQYAYRKVGAVAGQYFGQMTACLCTCVRNQRQPIEQTIMFNITSAYLGKTLGSTIGSIWGEFSLLTAFQTLLFPAINPLRNRGATLATPAWFCLSGCAMKAYCSALIKKLGCIFKDSSLHLRISSIGTLTGIAIPLMTQAAIFFGRAKGAPIDGEEMMRRGVIALVTALAYAHGTFRELSFSIAESKKEIILNCLGKIKVYLRQRDGLTQEQQEEVQNLLVHAMNTLQELSRLTGRGDPEQIEREIESINNSLNAAAQAQPETQLDQSRDALKRIHALFQPFAPFSLILGSAILYSIPTPNPALAPPAAMQTNPHPLWGINISPPIL